MFTQEAFFLNSSCLLIISKAFKQLSSPVLNKYRNVDLQEFEISADNISVYPNPAADFVIVGILTQNMNEEVTITLFDAIGKIVYY